MPLMTDGFSTTITLLGPANTLQAGGNPIPGATFAEITVTPPGVSGRGPIDVTTMRNVGFVSKVPKSLSEITDLTMTVAYDPNDIDLISAAIRNNQVIAVDYPTTTAGNAGLNDRFSAWGFLDEFKPGPNKEGDRPTAEIKVCWSLLDDDGFQVGPLINGKLLI